MPNKYSNLSRIAILLVPLESRLKYGNTCAVRGRPRLRLRRWLRRERKGASEKKEKKGEKTKKGRRMVARETDARENAGEEKERR